MRGKNAVRTVWDLTPRRAHAASSSLVPLHSPNMSPRALMLAIALACLHEVAARPVRRTLNFNMFVLRPRPDAPDRLLVSTEGVSRFGPILEYLVQRVQGLMSVRVPPEPENVQADVTSNKTDVPVADAAENEVDSIQEARMPGVVVRPSRTKPGTYEVEIDVVVDDGKPEDKEK